MNTNLERINDRKVKLKVELKRKTLLLDITFTGLQEDLENTITSMEETVSYYRRLRSALFNEQNVQLKIADYERAIGELSTIQQDVFREIQVVQKKIMSLRDLLI